MERAAVPDSERGTRFAETIGRAGLEDLDVEACALSGGWQKRLAIVEAIVQAPDILLLDEPSEGLAPIVVATIGKVLRELGASGATILLAEQNMHFCLRIAEQALVIDKGKVVHRQDTAGLIGNEDIRRRYLSV